MSTGQAPKRRETDEEAATRVRQLRDRNAANGYDKNGKLIGKEKRQVQFWPGAVRDA